MPRSGIFWGVTDTDTDQIDIEFIVYNLKLANDLLQKVEDVHSKIEPICSDNEFEEEVKKYEEIQGIHERIVLNLTRKKKTLEIPQMCATQASGEIVEKTMHHNSVRLPELKLPTFMGEVTGWLGFADSFQTLVIQNPNLSDIQRLQYLKSCLKGNALAEVENLATSSQNFMVAWNLLKDRYENTKLIIRGYIEKIVSISFNSKKPGESLRLMLTQLKNSVQALKSLQYETNALSEQLIIYLVENKLDLYLKDRWLEYTDNQKPPSLMEFETFLEKYCQIFESKPHMSGTTQNYSPLNVPNKSRPNISKSSYPGSLAVSCLICTENHSIYFCPTFLQMDINQRFDKVKEFNLCCNCLKVGHSRDRCYSKLNCNICDARHNSLLHKELFNEANSNELPVVTVGVCNKPIQGQVILPTAVILVKNSDGLTIPARVLLDSGSELNFISETLVQQLKLKRKRKQFSLSGIGNKQSSANFTVECSIQSRFSNYKTAGEFVVLDKITQHLPSSSLNLDPYKLPIDNNILADPMFYISQKIDMLLGCEVFLETIKGNKIMEPNGVSWLESEFGWICCGRMEKHGNEKKTPVYGNFHISQADVENEIDVQLTKFWKLDEFDNNNTISQDDKNCLEHYQKNVTRTQDGKYSVRMPLKQFKLDQLGSSQQVAERVLMSIEKKLDKNPLVKEQYQTFMDEYLTLDHMEIVEPTKLTGKCCFLPHHPVLREDSLTTKLRVVFNASAKTSTGISLNDFQYTGPRVQEELFSLLIRSRLHKILLCADVEKMYRQILLDPDQRNLQLILWRRNSNELVQIYQLKTITYGTASAPFLATQTLLQLAEDERHLFPVASRITRTDFYMDDLITGCENIDEAKVIVEEMIQMFKTAGMSLRKWCSNSKEVLSNIASPSDHCSVIDFDTEGTVKTLGLIWNPGKDSFQFHCNITTVQPRNMSKRKVLSEISKLFDPLGLVSPLITSAKILMQALWQCKLSWDECIPTNMEVLWRKFLSDLTDLDKISIPRLVLSSKEELDLHVFTDASEKAYGVCIYVKSQNLVRLLCSKSRIAPLKSVSIPRLELCGATLAVSFVNKIKPCLPVQPKNIYYWTDSSIVLSWIQSESRQWKSFVANRVGEIQRLSDPGSWKFVSTHHNPADLISRGASANFLSKSELWWTGPGFLSEPLESWKSEDKDMNKETKEDQVNLERKRKILVVNVAGPSDSQSFWNEMLLKYSSIKKLERVLSYVRRFIQNCKNPVHILGPLTLTELDESRQLLCKAVQEKHFSQEIQQLRNKKGVSKKSLMYSLNPILDSSNIIRVGGRLEQAIGISYGQKHPIILPSNNVLTDLLIQEEHGRCLHGGVNMVLYNLRLQYWPLHGKSAVKRVLRKCVTCFKAKPTPCQQLMGHLPKARVSPGRPFLKSSVDYGSPVYIKASNLRKAPLLKHYVCLFVCMTTKAVHLELVSDLSTETFIAALKRFISRRGKCVEIYSDNGSNFVGAKNVLQDLQKLFADPKFSKQLLEFAQTEHLTWHFIPPNSPHMGGLWEAGIKSTKYHLQRIVGEHKLTYEQYSTLLTQIEAVLNSRPLYASSEDPNDYTPLTPGHFLIGSSFQAFPEHNYEDNKAWTLANKFRLVQQLYRRFWERWTVEYLHTLQQRNKWRVSTPNVIEGMLVLVIEDNLPPLMWKMARIVQCLASADGLVRTVTLRFPNGNVGSRAISKICLLPIDK
ncbi:hypothetical protein M8J77_007377 [Diaphorina citri]|nr:hypothetical protein M8J77_007377 [Diaphorina citri]